MGWFKLGYSALSVILCTLYNPFFRCTFCRKEEPPGYVMLPFSFGIAIFTHYITTMLLPKRPSLLPSLCQPAICLNVQNVLMYLWVGLDELALTNLSRRYLTEEEILHHWWYLMFSIGVVISVISLFLTKCNRGHVYFDNQFQIRPCTYYWNRLIDKKVHFGRQPSIIPQPNFND